MHFAALSNFHSVDANVDVAVDFDVDVDVNMDVNVDVNVCCAIPRCAASSCNFYFEQNLWNEPCVLVQSSNANSAHCELHIFTKYSQTQPTKIIIKNAFYDGDTYNSL